MTNTTIIVVGALRDPSGRFFVVERRVGHQAGKWEFPGGIVRPHETCQEALVREWKELLCVTCKVQYLLWTDEITTEYDSLVTVITYSIDVEGSMNPTLSIHKQYRWMYPNALKMLDRQQALQPDRMKLL